MPKSIPSPVSLWPGSVTHPDYLTLPQVIEWRRAWNNAQEFIGEGGVVLDMLSYRAALLPGVLPCFIDFSLDGLPKHLCLDNFPGSPAQEAAELCDWMLRIISGMVVGEQVPKA